MPKLSPSGWNRFQAHIDPIQNWGTVISKNWPRIIRLKISLLESVTFQLRYRMLSSSSAQSLKSYGHFSTMGSRSLSVTAMLKQLIFRQKVLRIHQSTASERTSQQWQTHLKRLEFKSHRVALRHCDLPDTLLVRLVVVRVVWTWQMSLLLHDMTSTNNCKKKKEENQNDLSSIVLVFIKV